MRFNLTHKYVASLLLALSISCPTVLFVSIHFMDEPIKKELDDKIKVRQQVIQAINDFNISHFTQIAEIISHNDNLILAIQTNDHEQVMQISKQIMKESGSDFITVTDDKGTVVGRGHSEKWQDSALSQETVAKALQGTPAAAVVAGTVVPFTIRASQPIR